MFEKRNVIVQLNIVIVIPDIMIHPLILITFLASFVFDILINIISV